MAAFSSTSFQQHHPFLLDSVFLPTSPSPSPSTTNTKNIMPPMSPPFLHHFANHSFNQQNLINQDLVDNDASVVNKNSMDNSSSVVTDKHNKKRKCKAATSANSAQSKDKREVKGKKQKKIKDDEEEEKNNSKEENKADYIHVRARRGQATDSHSLAERVRRERISERMKLLQALVPGCDKVTGKALMLDEIINYVQSLQNQVEFLSMKLASVNPMFYDFGVDLESFMVRPDQDLSEFPSPMASMQECSPTTGSSYNFLDNNLFLLQQAQLPNDLPQPQGSRQSLWEVDEHRQRIMNEPGINNSLFSFH